MTHTTSQNADIQQPLWQSVLHLLPDTFWAIIFIALTSVVQQSQSQLDQHRKTERNLRKANKHLILYLTEIQVLQAKLSEQAIRDPLTSLYNRRYLEETIEREVHRADRENLPLSIIMLDLDHFKQVNDTYGHDAGDLMLKMLSGLLQKECRKGDVACRYGGEEFCIIMPGAPLEIASERAERWRILFSQQSMKYKNKTVHATASFGVATYPHHGLDGRQVIASADQALYVAKQNGRNQVMLAPAQVNALRV